MVKHSRLAKKRESFPPRTLYRIDYCTYIFSPTEQNNPGTTAIRSYVV